jgi:NMD protein affecting ribosome stability and mRNA decay
MTSKPNRRSTEGRDIRPKPHDSYRRRRKSGDATVCEQCSLVFHGGRWYRGAPPLCDEQRGLCPACERIRARDPAGTVRLAGLPDAGREEVIGLIRNVAEREEQEHPLERIIELSAEPGGLLVTTTGMHLARCLGSALRRRFHGGVGIRYREEGNHVQVDWHA